MENSEFVVGIDFDNTIVSYDSLFYTVALDNGFISPDVSKNKTELRDHLRQSGKEKLWNELQGLVYGPGISKAKPFSGVIDFFKMCTELDLNTYIISHKTRYPVAGEKHDLHYFALQFLEQNNFLDVSSTGLSLERIFFEHSQDQKIEKIVQLSCTHFIDDLPELFANQKFPDTVEKILFDPHNIHHHDFLYAHSWDDLQRYFAGKVND